MIMELNEMKQLWKKETINIEEQVKVNEQIIVSLQKEKSVNAFEKNLKVAILGRNLAFVYFALSIILSGLVIQKPFLSIPGFIGGFLMLWSFFSHLKIQRPDYNKMSIIELQKFILHFRIHTDKNKKYDYAITSIWMISLYPIYLHFAFKKDLYEEPQLLLWSVLFLIILLPLSFVSMLKMYKKIDNQLKESENLLQKAKEFEEV